MLARQFFGQLSFFYIGALAALKLEQWLKHKWLWLALLLTGIALMQINDYVEIALWPFVAGGLVIWTSMSARQCELRYVSVSLPHTSAVRLLWRPLVRLRSLLHYCPRSHSIAQRFVMAYSR